MSGLLVFRSLADALRAGFTVYDRTPRGYLVRQRTQSGWALAVVECRPKDEPREADVADPDECC